MDKEEILEKYEGFREITEVCYESGDYYGEYGGI